MMKQLVFSVFCFFLAAGMLSGQEYKKQLKNANKTLGKYYLDAATNKALLQEATASIDQIFKADDAKADPEAWVSKAQIFNEIAKTEITAKVKDPNYMMVAPDAALVAFEAANKAMSLATKKSHTKDGLSELRNNEDHLNNMGIFSFQVQDYDQAFKNFSSSITAYETLKANGEKSRLDDPAVKKDQIFYTGVCAYYGSNKENSIPYFTTLYTEGNAQPLVYEGLFTLTAEKDEAKAMAYLDAGRKAHPDDSGLLFAEINYYLKVGKLALLTDKLKAAIAKEPDNVSVYTTLGSVYDQLNQKERSNGDVAKADEYFNLAFDYYKQALERDPNNFDAVYSQGALYYNKAASMTSKLNELSNDFSSAGTRKYNELKAQMDSYFKDALPYFQKAETLDPKDGNTMIALKEIYARTGDLTKSAEYKAKLEKLGSN